MDDNESTENLYSQRVRSSKDHNNWLIVGELIRLIKEPVALYTTHIIEEWHAKLPCLSLPQCTNPAVCLTKKNHRDLCHSCKGWYDELAKSHRNLNKRQIRWRGNCNTSKWPNEPWEVAKFFMSALGDNKISVKDAESTDLSSLLNVLEWTEDAIFAPDRRVDRNLVKKLRSEVRNAWAHAPDQKLAEATLNDAFHIANNFAADLYIVFNRNEVKECIESIKDLQANGISNVTQTELKILNLLRFELGGEVSQMKEQLKRLKDDQSSDRKKIKMLEEKLENLETGYIINNAGTSTQWQLKSCIPDKPETFIGRDDEVKQIISYLVENGCGIVSIVGGPGFGKSTVAIEVCHDLSNNNDTVVFFSYLQNISTVAEVILRLCQDVGVNPGENPESSLMLRLKSIEMKVVLVMDNIEQLLESNEKPQFDELVLTLRKNVGQHLQILTTSRTEFTIHEQQFIVNHPIQKLDERFSVELLKRCCPSVEISDAYLNELADLCGGVPLALCIAGTIIPDLDDPSELIQWLKVRPMEALKRVEQAFEFSLQKLSDEDKKSLVCLSVFDGNFQRNSAKEVIGRDGLKTLDFLKNLVSRSLIQRTGDKRFVIHSLIRRFLADHVQFKEERAIAQELMVTHFLKMCHTLTMECYSKNEFISARESLKKDVHNVEETLKICSQDQIRNLSPSIHEVLASSDVYKSSFRFFHNFSWDLLPETVLCHFFQSCITLAESRNEPTIEMLFKCLATAQEGHKSAWRSKEYSKRIESIQTAFQRKKEALKEDRYVFMLCYDLLARHYFTSAPNANNTQSDFTEDELSRSVDDVLSPMEKVAEAYILKKQGSISKLRGNKMFHEDQQKKNEHMNRAESFYNRALSLAKELLGDHVLTCALDKLLGDLCFNLHKNEEALTYYTNAINLHKKLKLDSNEQFVMLLKNCGGCLSILRRFDESEKTLKEARSIADKISGNTRCRAQVYCELAITCSSREPDCREAAGYAHEAIKMQEFLESGKVEKLRKIIQTAEIIKQLQDIAKVQGTELQSHLKSCIPDKPQIFIGRDAEVKQIISSLVENDCGIVSIVGGPGFGKSTIAYEVSHQLSNKHGIVVIFTCLSHASTVSEVRKCLCRVVGINPGESPESSLTFWLKSIEKKVILVMDNIEQLLETNVKSKFIELVCSLRKNSHQHLHILTTTRTTFSVSGQTTENHQIGKLDEKSSIEILRRRCRNKVNNAHELAKLCGFVPLALCIAGAIIPDLDDPSELVQWLRKKSMEAEKKNSPDQCVEQIIKFSFQKLTLEDQKGIVCLSVFNGNFEINSAREVIDKNESQTAELLKKLVSRSLIQFNSDKRYVMHSVIRRFLVDHHKEEKSKAQGLMVNHFLVACHSLTMECYSLNGFATARESLKKDIHNIEETLRICTQDQATSLNADILQFLTSSNVYKSPSFFFYNFSLDLLSESVLWNFFESCFRLAESRKQPAIEITFQCLLAYQEGLKSAWKSSEYKNRLRTISAAFCKNKAVLKEDRFFFMFCYYFSARYNCRKATNPLAPDLTEDDLPALPDNKTDLNPEEKATKVHFLIERANIYKKRANKAFKEDKGKYNEHLKSEKDHYEQALALAKTFFGDNELTCIVCKLLGDLYFSLNKYTEALTYYYDAVRLRTKLGLDGNESFVFLLKNCGVCLSNLGCFDVSVETLKKSRDMADKLTEKETLCRARVNYVLARTCLEWKHDCQEAAGYAKEAMKMWKSLDPNMVETLENIIRRQEEMTLDSLDN
ncbi:uncharacterized protein LOC114520982 [Dendronephthya gigantea]|uniref:uncharacterized protein LOC114520982 n=1 Tax=Dendronephthya gigantea TaxID=151771 RepID=UPI00106CE30F|nr:uncharacterized protein LOC114520982 [Dendronephthya gigantea]